MRHCTLVDEICGNRFPSLKELTTRHDLCPPPDLSPDDDGDDDASTARGEEVRRVERETFLAMSAADLFAGAGATPGVEAWRIESMKPVKQPASFDGKLYSGDSYIVLHTWEQKGTTHMNVHFWLGSESSRDEQGAAALLTVELDQLLGDLPTQFREVQGSESPEFLQLFKNGVQYLEGGVVGCR